MRGEAKMAGMTDLSTLVLAGELDVAAAQDLRERLDQRIASAPAATIVVDLEDVTFLDSVILGVLVGAVHRARDVGGDLELVGVRPSVRRVFSITGVDGVITIHD